MDKNRALRLAFVITGTILGAGFASGQEIMRFFIDYGRNGFIGIVAASIIFALLSSAVIIICSEKELSFESFNSLVFGKFFGDIMYIIAIIFLMCMFSTMIAGGGAVISSMLEISLCSAALFFSGLLFMVFLFDVKGIIRLNLILCPVLIIGSILTGVYIFYSKTLPAFSVSSFTGIKNSGWLLSAVLYVSYNIITVIPVLCVLSTKAISKKTAYTAGIMSGCLLAIPAFFMAMPLAKYYFEIHSEQLPLMLLALNTNSKAIKYCYTAMLLGAIFTTAAANGFALINWLNTKYNPLFNKILVCLTGFLLSSIGFSNMVGHIYPFFGFIGIFQLVFVLFYFFVRRKSK